MTTIPGSVGVDAPPEAVFEHVASPENRVGTGPGLVEVRNVRPLPDGGNEADFTFRLFGRDRDAHSRDVVFDPPRRRVYEFVGDVDGRVTYEFTAAGDAREPHGGDRGGTGRDGRRRRSRAAGRAT